MKYTKLALITVAAAGLTTGLLSLAVADQTDPPYRAPSPTQPAQPGSPATPDRRDSGNRNEQQGTQNGRDPNERDTSRLSGRRTRPFALQNPQDDAVFTESARRLVQMEQRMEQTQQALLQRLGAARQLTGERQNAAVLDVLQQMLNEQAQLYAYLAQSRTAWAGDIDQANDPTNESSRPGTRENPGDPARTPNQNQPQQR